MSPDFGVLCFLLLQTGALGFGIIPGSSMDHLEITEKAILNVTVHVCRSLAQEEGTDFTIPPQPFTSETVAVACSAQKSSKSFQQAIRLIKLRNVRVDLRHALNASFHFDEEMFVQGRRIITTGLEAVKASNKQQNFEAARQNLGKIMHPLQDFYSHSNWVEIGNTQPNANLLRSDTSIGNIAAESRATCRNCDGDDCSNNILEDIIAEKILTSGYFGIIPFASSKPPGKCSHGGAVDLTSQIEPKGGINKDTFSSDHGHLHMAAADMATAATSELLEEVRRDAGDRPFLQMIGISKGSSKALCFVMDTTSSMREDIATVKQVASSIINTEVGTENEPSIYILVPFNDPDFGPERKTTEPDIFKDAINSLSAAGGGDREEMSLSGLKLALTAAPKSSEIFLFTDAPAKDKELKSTIIALIERTQTVVTFLVTETPVLQRLKRHDNSLQPSDRITESEMELYRDLAQTSGGQAIEVAKNDLQAATSIIAETTSPSLVTLLQVARSPGRSDEFSFVVDETVTDLIVFMTGHSITYTLTSPTGETQETTDTSGPLITSSQSVGNFQTLRLKEQVGTWKMAMASANPYTLKVIGQSPIDFLFDFVEASSGLFAGFDALDTRPQAGVNGSLLVSLTGSDTANVTEVALVDSSGAGQLNGTVEPQGNGDFLVQFDTMPAAPFVVRVKGRDNSGAGTASIFQRQSPINLRASQLTITADADSILVPGTPFTVPFAVTGNGIEGNVIIRATNNRGFTSTFPSSLVLETQGSANDTVTLSAPLNTPSGTDVTLTIEAEATGAGDSNYVVLQFSVINSVTDFTKPECRLVSLSTNCSLNCTLDSWTLSVHVSDGAEGTGVASVTLKQGDGDLSTSVNADNVTVVSYRASCCSPDVELQVEDRVENKDVCFYTAREGSQDALSASPEVAPPRLLCLGLVVLGLWVLDGLGLR